MRSRKTAGSIFILALLISAVASASALANPEFLGSIPTAITGTSGATALESESGLAVECPKDKVTGTVNSASTLETRVDLESCKVAGFTAQSLGDKSGVVLVPLTGKLCYRNSFAHEVGVVLTLPSGGVHIEVPSLGELLVITGSILGALTPVNVSSSSGTLEVFATLFCEGVSSGLSIETAHNGSPLGAKARTTESLTYTHALTLDA